MLALNERVLLTTDSRILLVTTALNARRWIAEGLDYPDDLLVPMSHGDMVAWELARSGPWEINVMTGLAPLVSSGVGTLDFGLRVRANDELVVCSYDGFQNVYWDDGLAPALIPHLFWSRPFSEGTYLVRVRPASAASSEANVFGALTVEVSPADQLELHSASTLPRIGAMR